MHAEEAAVGALVARRGVDVGDLPAGDLECDPREEADPIVPAPPELDPAFYAPPTTAYIQKAPGEIIAARQINPATLSLIPLNVDAWDEQSCFWHPTDIVRSPTIRSFRWP